MPNFDHTGPQGMGSRTGRGAGNCRGMGQGMARGKGNARNTAERGMGTADDLAQASEPGMGQGMGQSMAQSNREGRCCRHGQRHSNRARHCGMGSANQADSSGAAPAAGSDGMGNNS